MEPVCMRCTSKQRQRQLWSVYITFFCLLLLIELKFQFCAKASFSLVLNLLVTGCQPRQRQPHLRGSGRLVRLGLLHLAHWTGQDLPRRPQDEGQRLRQAGQVSFSLSFSLLLILLVARVVAICDGAFTCERTDSGGCSQAAGNKFFPKKGCGGENIYLCQWQAGRIRRRKKPFQAKKEMELLCLMFQSSRSTSSSLLAGMDKT